MKVSSKRSFEKSIMVLVTFVTACGIFVALVIANVDQVSTLLKSVIGSIGIGRGHDHLAIYDDLLLTASSEEFYSFSSGHGRNQLATMRIKFPNGECFELENITLEAVANYTREKSVVRNGHAGTVITNFNRGFNSFSFDKTQLWGITLQGASGIQIDFGDGQFVGLPVPRERVLEVLGPPVSWERSVRGMP